ncbi:MAG: hypothetical protein R6U51_08230 [Anaerolineales bacterium]
MFKTMGPPKPTKYAPLICTLAMVSAAIGIVVGLIKGNPLWIIICLFPAVLYEIYRTQGVSTKWASWGMLLILVAEIFLITQDVNFNLAEFLGRDSAYVGGQYVQLGDIKSLGSSMLAVIAMILAVRTAGIYTKWLAGIILVSSLALIFSLDPVLFGDLLKSVVETIFDLL